MKKVSLILPVYNTKMYLDECMESLVGQTYENIEIIVVDDGATDGSGEVADAWAQKDARVKVIHKKNGGLSAARNTGLKQMTGELVAFIDSDDYVAREYVEKLVERMEAEQADMAMCNYYRLYPDKCNVDRWMPGEDRVFTGDEYMRTFYTYSGSYSVVWNKVYRREIFDRCSFQEGTINEDCRITLELMKDNPKIAYTNEPLYYYRRRKSGIMGGDKEKLALSELDWLNDHMQKHRSSQRNVWFQYAQKLYISKIVENYYLLSEETQKEVKQKLKKELKQFLKDSAFGMPVKAKYILASICPMQYGSRRAKKAPVEQYFD